MILATAAAVTVSTIAFLLGVITGTVLFRRK